jgi:hypothetical protein
MKELNCLLITNLNFVNYSESIELFIDIKYENNCFHLLK